MAGPEKQVEAGFARWCREQGLFCLKLAAISVSGFPDRTVLLPGGVMVCIEFKSSVGRTSKVQDQRIAALRKLGFEVLVTCSKDEAIQFVKDRIDASRG
jgi:hypothetical protein